MSEKITKYLTPIVALFFATALGVTASSTIGTDITTEGDLNVTGTTTLSGPLEAVGSSAFTAGVTVDPDEDDTYELAIATDVATFGKMARFVPQTSDPVACAAGTRGMLGYANVDNQLCVCDGTNYVWVASTTVTCTFNAS